DFIQQKPYVQGYMTDQVKEKILSGEAAIAPLTSGDVQYVYLEGGEDEYCFIIPEEGTQFFIDAWCILKNAKNTENAYKFIDYMCREDVARLNAEYVGYETVNDKTPDEEFLYMRKMPEAYYDYSKGNNELERDVKDAIRYYSDGYNRIKVS
ncbi:MAG: extracellular solute-binding protein, partial [Lachnospiraceae bacterium]|nr:extracellular solute-binding protein [Lachnospiraceae bacterium]